MGWEQPGQSPQPLHLGSGQQEKCSQSPTSLLNKKILCRDLNDFINSQSGIYITPGGILPTPLQKHLSTESR